MKLHLRAMGCHMPYEIAQCYLPACKVTTSGLNPIQTPVSITLFLKNGMRVYCLDLEIRHNILSLLHTLKDLRGLLFYMLWTDFRRIFLKIFVMMLLTLSAICVFVYNFIYPASAAERDE